MKMLVSYLGLKNNMKYFDGVIVVEGTGDVSFLSSFINAEYVILNGYDMPKDTIDYLLHIKNRKIVVLTDPDEAGKTIESRLFKTGLVYEYKKANIEKCNKRGKHGIAECSQDEILRLFSNELLDENCFQESISQSEFAKFGFMESKEKRETVSKIFHLGNCNSKTLFKRMNYNKITAKNIEELWK